MRYPPEDDDIVDPLEPKPPRDTAAAVAAPAAAPMAAPVAPLAKLRLEPEDDEDDEPLEAVQRMARPVVGSVQSRRSMPYVPAAAAVPPSRTSVMATDRRIPGCYDSVGDPGHRASGRNDVKPSPNVSGRRDQAPVFCPTPFSASRVSSSPDWNISVTMSQPPTNSPLT